MDNTHDPITELLGPPKRKVAVLTSDRKGVIFMDESLYLKIIGSTQPLPISYPTIPSTQPRPTA